MVTKVVRRVSFTGTRRGPFLGIAATGRRVRGEGTVIMRIAGGKTAEEWEMSNLLGLLQQLGAVPSFRLDAAAAKVRRGIVHSRRGALPVDTVS